MFILKMIVCFLSLVYVVTDAIERFDSDESLGVKDSELASWKSTDLNKPQISPELQKTIEKAYAGYLPEKLVTKNKQNNSKGESAPSEAELATGEVLDLLDGRWLFHLLAIVKDEKNKNFAVLKAKNIETGKSEIKKLHSGKKLSDYKMEIVSTKAIRFSHQKKAHSVELAMFKLN
ncbi:hypothetical protein HR060_08510 [Catenovulum sp. SM1970]|uniref:hypothetical protein n=1 Tax=Marinifaba aquimaris TaxID=2741323 RepID=UPI00157337A1|nr:hypothetical protein [Marinifaba aquimaris]NTS76911.1 hypothetical protein [Marinifaba aquimaris]